MPVRDSFSIRRPLDSPVGIAKDFVGSQRSARKGNVGRYHPQLWRRDVFAPGSMKPVRAEVAFAGVGENS